MKFDGDYLKRLRGLKGLTQDQLSEETGVSQSTISTIESGKTVNSSVELAFRFGRFFQVPWPSFFDQNYRRADIA